MSFIRRISPSQQSYVQNNNVHHSVLRKLSSDKKETKRSHQQSSDDRVARSIFGDVPLTDTERRFLSAASCGYLGEVQLCIQENNNLNLNCRDYLGRSALQLAVQGEHYDTIIYLLDRCSLDVVEEALLYAIKIENVKICDIFLNHAIYSDIRGRIQLEFQHGFYDQEESNSTFAPDITPIVLASQCNNFDIVHMLLQKSFSIQRPHNYFCSCTECTNHKTCDRFVHSRSRLNAYRGLASTAYISLSSDDPIVTAFELSRQLHKLAEREKEYKNEYKSLCEACKNYAVELLELCRSNEEVLAALHGGSNTRDLSRIKLAIRYEQKKFIAHASCQEHLMSIWYAGVPWFQHQAFLLKFIMVPFGILLIPLTAIVYVFLPYSKIGEILRSPFMKFMNYVCSYTGFLVLLFMETAQTTSYTLDSGVERATPASLSQSGLEHGKSLNLFQEGQEGIVNTLIIFYVVGMFWAECKQLLIEGVRDYFAQIWNFMDIAMLALYTASFSIQAVVHSKASVLGDFDKSHYVTMSPGGVFNPQVLAKVLFSVANVLSFARIAYILPASEMFGQLQISYGRMLQDVGKFIFIYVTVLIAFVCGLSSLYSLNTSEHFNSIWATTRTLFWATFGMGNSRAPIIRRPDDDDGASEDDYKVVEVAGYLLYGVYILGAVVVLINMLIAMMSNTFQEIQDDEDVEWKFARAKLWISFVEEGSTLPIPFNIIPTPKSLARMVVELKQCCFKRLSIGDTEPRRTDDTNPVIDYKAIMHKVVLRYIHKMKFDKKGDPAKDELSEARDEILSHITNAHAKMSDRLGRIERDIRYLETAVTGDRMPNLPKRGQPPGHSLQNPGIDITPRIPPQISPAPRPLLAPRSPRYNVSRSRWNQDREAHHRHASERLPKSQAPWNSPHRASYTAGGRRRLVNSLYLRDFRRPQRASTSDSPTETHAMAELTENVPKTAPLQRKTFNSSEV